MMCWHCQVLKSKAGMKVLIILFIFFRTITRLTLAFVVGRVMFVFQTKIFQTAYMHPSYSTVSSYKLITKKSI